MGQVNEWIGQDREFLRSFVSKWITDNDFRELIKTNFNKKLTKGRQRLLELLEKTNSESDFINWTTQERKLAHRLMPKENWIKELNLETLAEERINVKKFGFVININAIAISVMGNHIKKPTLNVLRCFVITP